MRWSKNRHPGFKIAPYNEIRLIFAAPGDFNDRDNDYSKVINKWDLNQDKFKIKIDPKQLIEDNDSAIELDPWASESEYEEFVDFNNKFGLGNRVTQSLLYGNPNFPPRIIP